MLRGLAGPSNREVKMGVELFAIVRSATALTQHVAATLPQRPSVQLEIGRSSEHLTEDDGVSAWPPGSNSLQSDAP